MPKGIYLQAINYELEELANIMNDTIYNKNKYYEFFKWHRYYTYVDPLESGNTDEMCAFCAFLNDKKLKYTRSVYTNISKFW